MNEVVTIIGGSLLIALAVALIVGGARSNIGTAAHRIYAITGGFFVLAGALLFLVFALPRVTTPYLLPSSIVGGLILGWIAGMAWGAGTKSEGTKR